MFVVAIVIPCLLAETAESAVAYPLVAGHFDG